VSQPLSIDSDALGSWAGVSDIAGNDFEQPVAMRHPLIAELSTVLTGAGARIAQLSGSGSTVFGIFDAPPDRVALEASLRAPAVYTRTATRVVAVEVLE
jgi:4-diphosphocytidyl-2C-methyl-D-erythritol kinase